MHQIWTQWICKEKPLDAAPETGSWEPTVETLRFALEPGVMIDSLGFPSIQDGINFFRGGFWVFLSLFEANIKIRGFSLNLLQPTVTSPIPRQKFFII
jgi:hypothetical protein